MGVRAFFVVRGAPAEMPSPAALAARREAERWITRIRSARAERAYITGEGVVVEYLVEYQQGKVAACVVFAEDPAKALAEAESAVATVEAL